MAEVELSTGVATLIARMKTNPEEFFGDADKWRFMFKENFRDVLTEIEKGMLHEALKAVRRQELDALVMRTLLHQEETEQTQLDLQRVEIEKGRIMTGTEYRQRLQPPQNNKVKKWF